ncbi:hypothetical protein MOMUL_22300 [Moorella mulderi DSM 14980]|uniref:Uncharacterized protein n=1 Tax=Moorella mulderi DSM 14980 TaxID=1122241 RepID=A0A151AV60_9FIRM|nr:hypothetical protein [Moorella mulderi]KYH31491.1 hypothetical protein MOMUL_22300 [Moorella mulderi DSM 14980]
MNFTFLKWTFYDFRHRVYEYTLKHPEAEDLIFQQFQGLLDHFIAITKIKTNEQRMDSTAIMPNIKRARRLTLAFYILKKGGGLPPGAVARLKAGFWLKPRRSRKYLPSPKRLYGKGLVSLYDEKTGKKRK